MLEYYQKLNSFMEEINTDEGIELKILFNALKRNKNYILKFIFSGFIFGLIIAISAKKTWEGEFQIVLDETQDLPFASLENSPLEALLSEKKNKLKTEVGILKSSSILMDVFDFVENDKSLKKGRRVNLRFKSWKKSLDFNLQKGTSILRIVYEDNDKDIILPVLNRISNAYQDYSGRNRQRGLDSALEYYKNQIKIFKTKSLDSIKEAQSYAIDQDLTILGGNSEVDYEIPNSINIEAIRTEASEKIKNINFQLKRLEEFGDDPEILLTLVRSIPQLVEQGLPQNYDDLTAKLLYQRSVFTEEDRSIQKLKREKELIIQLFKERSKSYLEAAKISAEARLAEAERPEGVLIKYKELLREAFRDKKTLEELENQFNLISLENAKSKEPWELITKPTLSQFPVGPKRSIITLFGMFLGLLIGVIASLILDNKKGIIYNSEMLLKYFRPYIFEEFSNNSENEKEELLTLISKNNIFKETNSIAFLNIEKEEYHDVKKFLGSFKKIFNKKEILITNKISETLNHDKLILLTKIGITKRDDLVKLQKKLSFVQREVSCIFVLKDSIYK